MKYSVYFLFSIIGFFCACNSPAAGTVSPRPKLKNQSELSGWIEENRTGLVKSRTVDDLEVEARYMPSEHESNSEFNFLLKISSAKGDHLLSRHHPAYNSDDAKTMYWSSGIRKRLWLVTDKDTMPCSAVVYENVGNIRNDVTVNIGFSGALDNHKTYRLVYDDEYFGLGRLNFTFDRIISQVPLIETSN